MDAVSLADLPTLFDLLGNMGNGWEVIDLPLTTSVNRLHAAIQALIPLTGIKVLPLEVGFFNHGDEGRD